MSLNLPDPNRTVGDPNHTQDTNLIIEGINTLKSQVDGIPAGPQGPQGEPGTPGQNGAAATIEVANTLTSAPGSNAAVTASGTPQNVSLTFTIPRGETGPTGATGAQGAAGPEGQAGSAAAISVGTTTTGAPESNATVTNSGTTSNAVLNFTIPRGAQGEPANLGNATPQNLGTAGAGTSTSASRQDHVHNMPSASDVGADPVGAAAAAQSAAESYADGLASNYDVAGAAAAVAGNLTTHEGLTANVHGITDTANLVYTNDARLSDVRTPADGSVTDAKIVSGGLAPTSITGTAVVTNDARLSDERTPLNDSVTSAKIVDGTIVNADISATAAVAFSKLADGTSLSVLGRSANSNGAVASIEASSNHQVLRRSGSTLGFGTIDAQGLSSNSVTSAKIENGAVTSAKIANGTIVNADINDSAAINPRKIDAPRIHYVTTQPSSGLAAGDIWVDSDGTA